MEKMKLGGACGVAHGANTTILSGTWPALAALGRTREGSPRWQQHPGVPWRLVGPVNGHVGLFTGSTMTRTYCSTCRLPLQRTARPPTGGIFFSERAWQAQVALSTKPRPRTHPRSIIESRSRHTARLPLHRVVQRQRQRQRQRWYPVLQDCTAPLPRVVCWRGALSLVRRPALDRIVSRSSCSNLLDNTPPVSSQPLLPN
jgi:hypothetical protein